MAPAQGDRRGTARTACEPLRVRLNVYREGTLVDLSQGGALVHLRSEPPSVSAQVTLAIEWTERTLHLPARIVRSIARDAPTESAAPRQPEYEVALEFLKVGTDDASTLARLINAQAGRVQRVNDVDTTRMKRPE